ncbi:NUDIX hydrolase [Simiduia aestuariiviva]|uniref:ADP-ribose pyrophosphatase YjhB (NUDIX family) n=1 Tax=Simiduia aestuariiviva TaxID=1510459 RepID=A0A839UNW6_9GAMM|nr:NUDIX hydrolase [Simiduia aestuariiviva]MBB3168230.1 ADP-ribose pyrophosphatase YjhB (NUDIX family) [Simiduia aestuariiviva]
MKFCSQCGEGVTLAIPEGDNRERHVCNACSTIHYQNPRIITGTLPVYDDQILLCKRAIEPRHGLWTLPAGFMENGETTEQGAIRETWEEASANVNDLALYSIFNLPQINQVYFFYRAQLSDLSFGPGEESLEVELFNEDAIPWDQLAFPVITRTLQHYLSDRKSGEFPVRTEDIIRKR